MVDPVVFGQPTLDQVRKSVLTDLVPAEASWNEIKASIAIEDDWGRVGHLEETVKARRGETEGNGANGRAKVEDFVDDVVGEISEIGFRVLGSNSCNPSDELGTTISQASI